MLLLSIALNMPSASAADYPTYLFLTVQPDPIGIGQEANVVYWMDKAPPTASGPRGDRWQGWNMQITSPDGKTETVNLPASDAAGSGLLKYTPSQLGNYTFKLTFPGQNIWNWYTENSGLETVYGHYVFKDSAMSISDGKLYAVTNEHSPSSPLYRGSKMCCIDAATGQGLWNITFWGLFPVIADGYALSLNYYDGQIYCFGKGESETTLTTSPKVSTLGNGVLIEGKVIDKAASADGAAAVSDTSMANWMQYLYMQQPQPTNATGVTVKLDVVDANGNYRNIGEVTTDLTGAFSYAWQPDISGKYTILASFSGSDSYGSSFAETAIQVNEVPQASVTPIAETAKPMTDTYILAVGVAIIIAVAIVGLVIISMLRKRPLQ